MIITPDDRFGRVFWQGRRKGLHRVRRDRAEVLSTVREELYVGLPP
jgi:hypothetical protein